LFFVPVVFSLMHRRQPLPAAGSPGHIDQPVSSSHP
jgi:hypothetical protein